MIILAVHIDNIDSNTLVENKKGRSWQISSSLEGLCTLSLYILDTLAHLIFFFLISFVHSTDV